MIIGITWGYTIYHMVSSLKNLHLEGIQVIQLSGSLGQGDQDVDGPKLAIRLADKLNGTCRLLSAPALVATEEMRDNLMNQPQIQRTIDTAKTADIVIQGIGALNDDMSSLKRAGYIKRRELNSARLNGAVGHVFARMIDIQGNEIGDQGRRVVSIPLESRRKIPWSIGISASPKKADAVLGALRGKYFNTIVIDEESAELVLDTDEAKSIAQK